jgi:ribosome maturation factor RimP
MLAPQGAGPSGFCQQCHDTDGDKMADIARLTEIIEPEAKALGFDLVRVKMMPSEAGDGGQALQIMAEDPATGQLIIDQCAALSRAVSDAMDAAEEAGETLIEGAYNLEVSSPGIDRPLTRAKDYANWAGYEAKVSMVKDWDGQRSYRGILKGIDGDMVMIEDRKAGEVSYPLEMVHSAKLVLTDELIAATQPLDVSGADDIVEEEEAQD